MSAPQIIMIILNAMALGLAIAEHGKPKTGNNNFWTSLIAASLNIGILYWGGFFN